MFSKISSQALWGSVALSWPLLIYAQNTGQIDIPGYVEKYAEVAMRHMVEHGIPASITLAQGILESAAGTSELATQANNHFGIKCHDWQGDTYTYDDDAKGECFRKYRNPEESYEDHALFLTRRPRYADLFKLDKMDYVAWAKGLKAAGYATLSTYPEKLIGYIEKYRLYRYDSLVWRQLQGQPLSQKNTTPQSSAHPLTSQKIENSPILRKNSPDVALAPAKTSGFSSPTSVKEQRPTELYNGLKSVIVRPGDTQESLAQEFGMAVWQIRRFNELGHGEPLLPGTRLYLEPRYDAHPQIKSVVLTRPETWKSLSAAYGVRSESLQAMNPGLGEPLPEGAEVRLSRN